MGMHSDANLWFGYTWDGEEFQFADVITKARTPDEEGEHDEWEDVLAESLGAPWPVYPPELDQYDREAYDAWSDQPEIKAAKEKHRDATQKAREMYPGIAFQEEGHCDYPGSRVLGFCIATTYGAGECINVDLAAALAKREEMTAVLTRFVTDERLGVDLTQAHEPEPRFFIVSSYG